MKQISKKLIDGTYNKKKNYINVFIQKSKLVLLIKFDK